MPKRKITLVEILFYVLYLFAMYLIIIQTPPFASAWWFVKIALFISIPILYFSTRAKLFNR